jgi:hypothetical protein
MEPNLSNLIVSYCEPSDGIYMANNMCAQCTLLPPLMIVYCPLCSSTCSNRLLHTVALEDAQNLVAGHDLDLCDTVRVTEGDANLRRCSALTSELADLVDDLLRSGLEPRWRNAGVWDGGGACARQRLELSQSH